LRPDSVERREALANLYDRDVALYGSKAKELHHKLLQANPLRVESLDGLFRAYEHEGNEDGAWCAAQLLRASGKADETQKEFFSKRRKKSVFVVERPFDTEVWADLVTHPSQDPLLTKIFTAITPAVVAAHGETLAQYGLDQTKPHNPDDEETGIVKALRYASWIAELPLPALFDQPKDPGGLRFLFTAPPSLALGQGVLQGGPAQALGFVAARHLSYYQPGHYVRQLVTSGTGLKGWLLAAIRAVSPNFPVPEDLAAKVNEHHESILAHVPQNCHEELRQLTDRLLETSPSLDMKRWVAAVDRTADRVGFIVSNDLEIATAVILASPEDSAALPRVDRVAELQRYALSTPYLELRSRLR
ncbi:MAG: hypothetical protein KC416_15345, partial [Myxococcales bacterium]|nr:hypothetical protein [Myxococcales bacterium]